MSYQETLPMPPPSSGTSPCGGGTFGGLITFSNGGAKFTAAAGTTLCTASIKAGGTAVPNAHFDMQWRSGLPTGCLANSGTYNKTFNSTAGKKYTFNVFFLPGHVPAEDTSIEITVNFT